MTSPNCFHPKLRWGREEQLRNARKRGTMQGREAGRGIKDHSPVRRMSDESRMPFPRPGERSRSQGLFNTAMGPLQRQLHLGEYSLLKFSPMFESDFVQISKKGGAIDVHNQVQLVRAAIAATSPTLRIPNVLLLARPVIPSRERCLASQTRIRHKPRMIFELTRLLPLCFVKISVHDQEKQQLRFKLVSGRTFYLQLCPQQDVQDDIFEAWVKIVHLLRPPTKLKHKLQEPTGEPEQEQGAPQKPEERSVEPSGLVDKENPEAESPLQEETKEKEDPAGSSQEPPQDQQSAQEDTSSSTSPPSQDETTEEERAPISEDQHPQEQLKETSERSLDWPPKTRPPASRKTTERNKSRRSRSSQRAHSYSKFTSLLIKSFSNPNWNNPKEATKKKGKKP